MRKDAQAGASALVCGASAVKDRARVGREETGLPLSVFFSQTLHLLYPLKHRLPSHHLATKPDCLLPVGFQSFPYTELGVDEPHSELKNHAETELPHALTNWGKVQVFRWQCRLLAGEGTLF